MRPLAILVAFLLLAPAAYAKSPRVNGLAWIGGLELSFDANRWQVNGADNAYDVFCTAPDCARTAIAITIADEADAACTPEALNPADADAPFPWHLDRFSHAGLTFLIAEGDFGCRNLSGGPVRACTSHGGKTYLFDAPGQRCHTQSHAGEHVSEILRGMKPR
jgi:hypothetical protein